MIPLAAFALAVCAAVSPESDRVLLRDLAAAFPGVPLAGETAVGFAPAPGVERRFDIPELRRIALQFHLPEPAADVCVTRPAAPPDPARLLAAMRAALPGAEVEILDYSRWPIPQGILEFPAAGLHGSRWTGAVHYGGGQRFVLWAQVRVRVPMSRAVAAHDLRAGQKLAAADFRVETVTGPPDGQAASPVELAGRRLRRAVPAGTAIRPEWTEPAPDVSPGDTVAVEVRSGAAVLSFEGEAEGAGNTGQTVLVLNPDTHKRFRARIDGPGRVSLEGGSL
jgi:flagella basal body P-ring formation protein FlgA